MDLMSYMDNGGVIMYILLGLNIVGFTIMIAKLFQYIFARGKISSIVDSIYGSLEGDDSSKLKIAQNILNEKMLDYERGLNTVKIIASIAPLLGLLGTVIGVLGAFEAISKGGLGDPSIFASGISLALITTVGGLIVAIPHYIGYNYLVGMLDKLEARVHNRLDQKIFGN